MGSPTLPKIAAVAVQSVLLATDTEQPWGSRVRESSALYRRVFTLNTVDAMAQGASCLPGAALIGGWVNAAYGVGKVGRGLVKYARADADSSMYLTSGAKSVALGLWAALDPINGWWANAICAGKDAVDAGMAAVEVRKFEGYERSR